MPEGQHRRVPHVDIWREAATELRRSGTPCLAASKPSGDGAGSSTIRHLASWIFAEEMGCDWVKPDWGKKLVGAGNGTVMYCHRTATAWEMDHLNASNGLQHLHSCSVVDWLAYFQFDVPSVSLPSNGAIEVIQARVYPFSHHNTYPVLVPCRFPQNIRYRSIGFNRFEWQLLFRSGSKCISARKSGCRSKGGEYFCTSTSVFQPIVTSSTKVFHW